MAKGWGNMRTMGVADMLVVDEDNGEAERTMAALQARGLGGKIVYFLDGDGALGFLGANCWSVKARAGNVPKLVLLDLQLGLVSGMDVLYQLKARERTRPIPVVVFANAYDEQEMLACYRLGANSYVVKPIETANRARLVGDVAYYWLNVNRL
jgi:two-component system response regulator